METYQLSEQELRAVQKIQLEMLCEVDRICRKKEIPYNIIAGTLLGAVRHGGFIPWDDDADVALLRPDYERFKKACETELDSKRFLFQDSGVTEGYRWGYGKLRRNGTLFLRKHQEGMGYHQGIFIDIFPLDSIPERIMARTLYNARCFFLRKLMWSPVGAKADPAFWKRIVYTVMSRYPEERLKRRCERFARRGNKKYRNSSWVRILLFPTPNREYGYLRAWYQKSRPYLFEGKALSGIYDYDEYLRFKFGDYMTLPDERDRKTHPITKLRLCADSAVEREETDGREWRKSDGTENQGQHHDAGV